MATGERGGEFLSRFKEIWGIDFEFRAPPGEHSIPVCMVAREIRSGRLIRLWQEELDALGRPPFDIGPESLTVAYYASAEMGCFLARGWQMPANLLDLYVEHRRETNGLSPIGGDGLSGALIVRGLGSMVQADKPAMREMILGHENYSSEQRDAILSYCQGDVDPLGPLLAAMSGIDWPRALHRARYMRAVARMEWTGVPLDLGLLARLRTNWSPIKEVLIEEIDRDFGVFEGTTFKVARFAAFLDKHGMDWPRLKSGALALDEDTFKAMAGLYPVLEPLRQVRITLSKLRLNDLAVGTDGRNRTLLSPFRSTTGRNQPSTSKFIFGSARFIRGLIKPPDGFGLAYIDWKSQEIAIAAALSGDCKMIDSYMSGDPYLAFAVQAGLVPADATKDTHPVERQRCKALVLGVNYGIGPDSLAAQLEIIPGEARVLMVRHHETYPRYRQWVDQILATASLCRRLQTVFGWQLRVGAEWKPRSLQNFPCQANGAEMMRIAAILATEAGIEVCGPIHDAFLIVSPLDRLHRDVQEMQEIMTEAGRLVTGIPVLTDAKIIRFPDRYMDEGGSQMWDVVMKLLARAESER